MKTYKKRFNRKRNRKILKGGTTKNLINLYEVQKITQEQIDDKIKLEVLLNICKLRPELNIEKAILEPLEKTDYKEMIIKITEELEIVEKK